MHIEGREGDGVRHFSYLVSLTIYIELEGRMIPQNDTLDEADQPNILSYHMAPWLNAYGQCEQKSKFLAKKLHGLAKTANIFSPQKFSR